MAKKKPTKKKAKAGKKKAPAKKAPVKKKPVKKKPAKKKPGKKLQPLATGTGGEIGDVTWTATPDDPQFPTSWQINVTSVELIGNGHTVDQTLTPTATPRKKSGSTVVNEGSPINLQHDNGNVWEGASAGVESFNPTHMRINVRFCYSLTEDRPV